MRSVRPVVDVEHARARVELARVDAEVGELADEGSAMILKASAAKGRSRRRGADDLARLVLAADGLEPVDRRDVERAGQVVDDGVEQRLDALVLERRAAQDRRQLELERGLADRAP